MSSFFNGELFEFTRTVVDDLVESSLRNHGLRSFRVIRLQLTCVASLNSYNSPFFTYHVFYCQLINGQLTVD